MSAPLILAVHEDTNANAALLRGTEIVAAVAEERLSRTKFQAGFPSRAVDCVLGLGGVRLEDVDHVVAGNKYHFVPRLLGTSPVAGEHDLFGPLHKGWLSAQALLARGGLPARAVERLNGRLLRRRFGRSVPLVDHHSAHAYSAWLTSGFERATAISIDNMGDGFAAKVFDCGGGTCRELWGSRATGSPGQFYGEISQFLGFHVLHAGKVTGLAARGDAQAAYPLMEQLFRLERDDTDFVLYPLPLKSKRRGPFRRLARFSREDVSAAAQKRLEDLIVRYVQRALKETGHRNVVLAGGVFANVLVNQRLWSLPEVDGLFVHPAMSDQGIAVGAALAMASKLGPVEPREIPHVFLGPSYGDEPIGRALEAAGQKAERCDDIEARVAELIVQGKVVARYDGPVEYGPRALGNRSILFHTKDPTVNDWLNKRLDRSEFMPFAPATLAEHAAEMYVDYGPGVAHTARFMTITLRCSEAMARVSPAVVHIDHTARPQVVHEEFAPGFHRILSLVNEATGTPSIINTSFNIHGEPIVCTPEDALRLFGQGRVDALAMGSYLVV